jgi:hypothetical protein
MGPDTRFDSRPWPSSIHDADECHDETIVQLYGGHVVRVSCALDEVLAWFA